MSIRTEGAGTFGTLAPFPIGEKRAGTGLATGLHAAKLGMEVIGPRGRKFRLVQYADATALAGASAAGANVAGARAFAPSTGNADAVETMFCVSLAQRTGAVPLNRTIGFALKDQEDLVQYDFFWLQFDGDYIDMFMGDDGTDAAIGDYISLDDDADLGCVYTTDTTHTPEFRLGVAIEVVTAVDTLIRVRPTQPING